jgi:hypothetical protein
MKNGAFGKKVIGFFGLVFLELMHVCTLLERVKNRKNTNIRRYQRAMLKSAKQQHQQQHQQ